jgi:hypothetical protein
MKLITTKDLKDIASEFQLTYELVKTVLIVESSGAGFDAKTEKIKIQFEPHIFHKQLALRKIQSTLKFIGGTLYQIFIGKTVIENKVDVQEKEWEAFEKSKKINEESAYQATSWGLGQIMGFNHKVCGFETAKKMAENFELSEANQLRGMMMFIKSNSKMFNALKNKDFETFARFYNGATYKKYKYDTKLKLTYEKLSKK